MNCIKSIFPIFAAALVMAASCCRGSRTAEVFDTVYYTPSHAAGFEIIGCRDSLSRVIRVMSPWQDADSTAFDLFIARGGENPPEGFSGQVIRGQAERIVAMSSSYVAMLDLVGETGRICGVSGMDFISNASVLGRRGSIVDVGNEADADFEKLVSVRPDLVLLYGITASSPMEGRLRSLGIPYMYVGEYFESDPLGKSEWIVAIAEVAGVVQEGVRVFDGICRRYEALKEEVREKAAGRPKVMLNVPYGDIWYMASAISPVATMIADAGGEYLYRDNLTNKSIPIDMEKAFALASEADFWFDTGRISSMEELLSSYPRFAGVRCVAEGNVFNNDRRMSPGGGNDFWESGQVRPDLVLEDLVGILHPELRDGEGLHYYRRLD